MNKTNDLTILSCLLHVYHQPSKRVGYREATEVIHATDQLNRYRLFSDYLEEL